MKNRQDVHDFYYKVASTGWGKASALAFLNEERFTSNSMERWLDTWSELVLIAHEVLLEKRESV